MMQIDIKYNLVLGSKSPRRSLLMAEMGLIFTTRHQDVDEGFDENTPVKAVAASLANRKSDALYHTLTENELLITADSVVILDDVIYNKPADYNEGIAILSKLSNRTHTVATGVCLRSLSNKMEFTVFTDITFDIIDSSEMDYYLSHYKPYDKAGAYGIQDWIGLCKVTKVEGSYSNVMGMPTRELYQALIQFKD